MKSLLRSGALLLALALSACGTVEPQPLSQPQLQPQPEPTPVAPTLPDKEMRIEPTVGSLTAPFAQANRHWMRMYPETLGQQILDPGRLVWSWIEEENAEATPRPIPTMPSRNQPCSLGRIVTSALVDADKDGIPALGRRSFANCVINEGERIVDNGYIEISDTDDSDAESGWVMEQSRTVLIGQETLEVTQRFELTHRGRKYALSYNYARTTAKEALEYKFAGSYTPDLMGKTANGGSLEYSGYVQHNQIRLTLGAEGLKLGDSCFGNPFYGGSVIYSDGDNKLEVAYSDCGQGRYLYNGATLGQF